MKFYVFAFIKLHNKQIYNSVSWKTDENLESEKNKKKLAILKNLKQEINWSLTIA